MERKQCGGLNQKKPRKSGEVAAVIDRALWEDFSKGMSWVVDGACDGSRICEGCKRRVAL